MSRKQSFAAGAALLAVAGIVVKCCSAVFKIPLDRMFLHAEGIAIYQSASTMYGWILVLSTSAIPIAVSNMVAGSANQEEEAPSIAKTALVLLLAICALCATALFFFARPLSVLFASSEAAAPSLRVLAPSLLFLAVSSAYRGYFQGRGDMLPTAVSQLIEGLCKIAFGLSLCALFVPRGLPYGAAGAIGGVAIGSAVSALYVAYCYRRTPHTRGHVSAELAKKLAYIALPIIIGNAGLSIILLSDMTTVLHTFLAQGMAESARLEMYGYLTRAMTIYNLPATVIVAVTVSIAPTVAAAWTRGAHEEIQANVNTAVRMTMLIAAPCMGGLALFPSQILQLIYHSNDYPELLTAIGVMAAVVPLSQVTTAILQATGSVWPPIFRLLACSALKIIGNLLLVRRLGLIGAPIATIVAYALLCVWNFIAMRRRIQLHLSPAVFLRPLAAAALACAVGGALYYLVSLPLLPAIACIAVLYVLLAMAFRAVSLRDFHKNR